MRIPSVAAAGLVVLAALGALRPGFAAEPTPSLADSISPAARERLHALLSARDGRARKPTSPRFSALRDPRVRGTRLLVAWSLPERHAGEWPALDSFVAELTARREGASTRRIVAERPPRLEVELDTVGDAPLITVVLMSPQAGAARELEHGLLETLATLASDSPAALVLRQLKPQSRAVVEIYGADADASVHRMRHPKLYVVLAGDTVARLARRFGVSKKALLEANRLEGEALRPGQKVVLPE
jgi:hypothetical protein